MSLYISLYICSLVEAGNAAIAGAHRIDCFVDGTMMESASVPVAGLQEQSIPLSLPRTTRGRAGEGFAYRLVHLSLFIICYYSSCIQSSF